MILRAGRSNVRLDHYLQEQLPEYSRARLQEWIKKGKVLVDDRPGKSSYLLKGTETITVEPEALPPLRATAEEIPLDILYLDDDVIAVNKPAGMVVHAGAGNHTGTLVNALLHRFGTLSNVSGEDRPGIVHRIDRETSGVLLVARHDVAHRRLAEQFATRQVEKIYTALAQGVTKADSGKIDKPIARDPVRRTRMTTRLKEGRTALSWWKVRERFPAHTLLEVKIGTGRTHQIRVHLASIHHPVAGDTLYGAAPGPIDRFFLHATRITFAQPTTSVPITIESPLPPELEEWLTRLRAS